MFSNIPYPHTNDWLSWLMVEGSPSLGDSTGVTTWVVEVVGVCSVPTGEDGEGVTDLGFIGVASSRLSSSLKDTDLAICHTTMSTKNAKNITAPVTPAKWNTRLTPFFIIIIIIIMCHQRTSPMSSWNWDKWQDAHLSFNISIHCFSFYSLYGQSSVAQ